MCMCVSEREEGIEERERDGGEREREGERVIKHEMKRRIVISDLK